MNDSAKRRLREIARREVEVINDLCALKPYSKLPDVRAEYSDLLAERGGLKSEYAHVRGGSSAEC